ncbi:GNAT family N-acetyltransferase [Bacillus paralicheniformis]|uniref:GNAT family N-acetyltransferase n=1 Tax=Bacillus paralicheniformis TaxID=1648923 RepID=UPI0021097877|nr:GNAT family N-acetyltransferase [Bacillus paralicheniformis]MCQ5455400.1 GNAT family N-acetyltransferase [Bacillus paralicheniformis]
MKDTIMKTDRMILRKMRRDDAENLLEIFSDPTAMEYYPSTKNEKQTLHWIDWTLENYEKHGTGLWVAEHKQTGEFLGQVAERIGMTLEKTIHKWGKEIAVYSVYR